MAQRLGTQAVLANDLSLNASAHVKSSPSPIPLAPGGFDISGLHRHLHTWAGTHIYLKIKDIFKKGRNKDRARCKLKGCPRVVLVRRQWTLRLVCWKEKTDPFGLCSDLHTHTHTHTYTRCGSAYSCSLSIPEEIKCNLKFLLSSSRKQQRWVKTLV